MDIQHRISAENFTSWNSETLSKIGSSFTLPIFFEPPDWARLLEQISFLALIVAKWLSPKGMTSRDKLSQLLLFFIGMASDILDLMDNLHDELITQSAAVVYIVLGCYTTRYEKKLTFNHVSIMFLLIISHAQFTFNLTAKRKYRLRWNSDETDLSDSVRRKRRLKYLACCCFESELWAMIITILSMDGLFLALRLYLFLGLNIVTFGNIFFAAKNGIVVAVDLYRIVIIIARMHKRSKEELDERKRYHEEDEDEEEFGDFDTDRVVDMHFVMEADGIIMASSRTLRRQSPTSNVMGMYRFTQIIFNV